MSNVYWLGTATNVAAIHTASIDSVDATPANNTFFVTIGGEVISTVGDTDVATTAAALVVLLNASTHPYFAAITWTNPSAGNIVGTADTAGVPFVALLTETGAGSAAVTDFAVTTATAGANDWSTASNWSGGAVPVNSDDVIIENSSVSIRWGLAQSAVTLTSLIIKKSFTGKIGLKEKVFATSSNGDTESTVDVEYRQAYLNIKATDAQIGENNQNNTAAGSGLIKLDLDSAASTTTIFGSAKAIETNKPAIQLLAASASTIIYVRAATGGVGIAVGAPFETSTIASVNIGDSMGSNGVQVGSGTTMTSYSQKSGTCFVEAAATVTTMDVDGGTLTLEGDYVVTNLNVNNGATVNDQHIKSGGNAVTNLNINSGGSVSHNGSSQARTIAVCNIFKGGTLTTDDDVVTITSQNYPTGSYRMTVTEA